ncbi:MAG: hypothetical protein JWO20_922 [Candidatus Angelobacter sp.]|jgi:hypothetical protein|nr:hypothetical protein [Candidatus Angelobacter sp.]
MKRYLFWVPLAVASVIAVAQDCSVEIPANRDYAKHAIQRVMLGTTVFDSWTEKAINRSGDSAAIVLLDTWPDDLLDSPEKIKNALFILKTAFPERRIATVCSDREPRITMLLLSHLEHLKSAAQLAPEIQATRAAILRNTDYVDATPGSKHSHSTPDAYLAWIDSGLRAAAEIKPGMTRKELLKTFIAGGSGFGPPSFVSRECSLVHINVKFDVDVKLASRKTGPDPRIEQPEDKILEVSAPYVSFRTMD